MHSRYGENLTIIGNVADDQDFHGLWVSPDIDTLTYTLAGQIDREKGWGLKDESNRTLDALTRLGVDTWMYLEIRILLPTSIALNSANSAFVHRYC